MHRTVKTCVVSGSRAEFGQLLPLLKKLNANDDFDLKLIVTGAHLLESQGKTVSEIIASEIPIAKCIYLESAKDNSRLGIAKQISEAICNFAEYFEQDRPDVMIAIGDRYEMFGAAVAASTLLIPIVHICGGSTTSGAIDEIYRHSMTKMSTLHFTTCEQYRKRVIQLGESPETVYNVGSLAIENCLKTQILTEAELREDLGIDLNKKYCVVTFHPVTLEKESSEKEVYELIDALKSFKEYSYIVTLSNSDAGGDRINEIWREIAEKDRNFYVVPSLGMKRYLSALKYSDMMIGNSSSGTTEGPAMRIPTIDIGDRQRGRYFAESIVHCEPKKDAIIAAIRKVNTTEFRKMLKIVENPFGDGNTSDKMIRILKQKIGNTFDVKKDFYDISFEVE